MDPLNIIDVETTGLSPRNHRIIELALIRIENGIVTQRYQQLINPEQPISSFIQDHTGITPAMVAKAPVFGDIVPHIQPLLATGVFVAHNADFDYSFVSAEFARHGLPFTAPRLCTVRLSRQHFPSAYRHNLDAIIRRHNLACSERHRALDDAEVVWQFYQLIHNQFSPQGITTY